ncbi:hypothetical protein K488DRAFT_89674 [Vararia minispora EC-137]|uniref:Uncharacterized protein n=1 Tax=Vararia minispora EC-137 TaxID=1314806 RepID=A0ACB8Q9U2_9AGAM|nr:hypothetical protein K488DRAFT_89674 [Vararia minispora EC-137]
MLNGHSGDFVHRNGECPGESQRVRSTAPRAPRMGTIPLPDIPALDYWRTPPSRLPRPQTGPLTPGDPRHVPVPLPDITIDHTHSSITPSIDPHCIVPLTADRALHQSLCAGALDWDIRTTPAHAKISRATLSQSALAVPAPFLHIHVPFFGVQIVTSPTHGTAVIVRDVLDALDHTFKQPVPRRILALEPQAIVEEARAARERRGGTHYAMMDLQGACVYFRGLVLQLDGSFAVRLDYRPLR